LEAPRAEEAAALSPDGWHIRPCFRKGSDPSSDSHLPDPFPAGIMGGVGSFLNPKRILQLGLGILILARPTCCAEDTYEAEANRLATLLNWQTGSVVADIGAGEGQMALLASSRVGAAGHVYATEVDPKKLAALGKLAREKMRVNLTVVQGAQDTTNLPRECCDSIFMRRVYHHFTDPAKIDPSLFQSLKPSGLLAVIDFPPRSGLPEVVGVPENRGGHGIPKNILINELTSAGFVVESVPKDWPSEDYCVIFRKPAP